MRGLTVLKDAGPSERPVSRRCAPDRRGGCARLNRDVGIRAGCHDGSETTLPGRLDRGDACAAVLGGVMFLLLGEGGHPGDHLRERVVQDIDCPAERTDQYEHSRAKHALERSVGSRAEHRHGHDLLLTNIAKQNRPFTEKPWILHPQFHPYVTLRAKRTLRTLRIGPK